MCKDVFYQVYNQREGIDLQKGSIKAFIAIISKRKAIDLYRSLKNKNSKLVPLDNIFYESTLLDKTNIEQTIIIL